MAVAMAKVNETEALKRVREFEREIDLVLALAPKGNVTIENETDYARVCDLLIDIKVRQKVLTEEHAGFMLDVKKLIDRVNSWFKPAIQKHATAEARYKDALRVYALHVEAEALALRQSASKVKDEGKRDELLNRAEALCVPKVAGVAYKSGIEVEIFDFDQLPREYKVLVADQDSIKAAIALGKKIPGVRWKDARSIAITPKNAGKGAE